MGRIRLKGAAAAAMLLAFAGAGPGAAQPGDRYGGVANPFVALDDEFIVGRWADDSECRAAVAFDEDGTYLTAEGAEGVWELDGDDLTLAGTAGTLTLRIIPIDRDTIAVVVPDGSLARSRRCENDGREPGPVARGIA